MGQDAPRLSHLRQDGCRRWPGVVGRTDLPGRYGRLAAHSSPGAPGSGRGYSPVRAAGDISQRR